MTLITLTIPKEYGFVFLAATGTLLLNIVHVMAVRSNRIAAKVPYPQFFLSIPAPSLVAAAASSFKDPTIDISTNYSSPTQGLTVAEHKFNCAQRAHMNYLENMPSLLISLFISGLVYPKASAGLAALWLVGRGVYLRGYLNTSKNNGDGRVRGVKLWYPAQTVLTLLSGWVGLKMVL